MTTPPAQEFVAGEWETWAPALQQFAAAAGLTVSLYDAEGVRRAGPFAGSAFGRALMASNLWSDTGAATALERALVQRTKANGGGPVRDAFEGLSVRTQPVMQAGACVGAVVFGWVPVEFGSSLAADRIARVAALDGRRLWAEMRLHSPVSASRMDHHAALMASIVESGARLRDAIRDLHAQARAREQYMARVAHELRTPLNTLSLSIALLKRSALDDPERMRRGLDGLARSVTEEARLVNDLVDAASSKTGKLSMTAVRCALAQILQEAIAGVKPQAEDKRIEVRLSIPELAIELMADPGRLRQAFWNILVNALKFTPPDGSVEVKVHQDQHACHIAIRDTGPGIPPQLQNLIFNPFVRQTENNPTGLGLGLSIAWDIVQQHGGTIAATNRVPPPGAQFVVTLPVPAD